MEKVTLHFPTNYKLLQFIDSVKLSEGNIDYSDNNLTCTLPEPDIEKAIGAFDAEKVEFKTPGG